MTAQGIVAAHQASNALPAVHATQRLTQPDGQTVRVDEALAPLVQALWSAGVQTVASCQNVREYVLQAWPERLADTLTDSGPLTHRDSTRDGLAYVRLLDEGPRSTRFLTAAGPRLSACRRLGLLVQIEFSALEVPALIHHVPTDHGTVPRKRKTNGET